MANYVCPWWAAWFTIDVPLRGWIHDPQKIVGPYVQPGMTAIDVGCGVGYFSIPMARMVGDRGKVIAVDLQRQMLDKLNRRAKKAGVDARIETHLCESNRLGIEAEADFALIFAMLHEVPDQGRLLSEIHGCLKRGGKLLLAEPPVHVTAKAFAQEAAHAKEVGFLTVEQPRVRWSRAVLLAKSETARETIRGSH
jgi:ubiquinone/menaquinone biosynthesis C-methylase UbiE